MAISQSTVKSMAKISRLKKAEQEAEEEKEQFKPVRYPGSSFLSATQNYTDLADAWPEVAPGIEPWGSRVLVQLRKPKSITKGGVILTDEARATISGNTQIAKVIALGPVCFKDRKTLTAWPEGEWCQPGAFVRTPKYGGDRWQVTHGEDEIEFAIFNDLELIGRIVGDPLAFKAYV